jgi:hypothetical protein
MLKLNLLPREYMLKREYRRSIAFVTAMFAAVLAVLGCAAALCQRQGLQVDEVRTRLAESCTEAAEMVDRIDRADVLVTEALSSANRHAALLDRVPVSCVMALVANALPERASLTDFELDVGLPAKTKASDRKPRAPEGQDATPRPPERQELRQRVSLGGTAATDVDVANFMANLSRNSLIERVELVQSREKVVESRTFREFLVEIDLKPNADAMDLQAPLKAKVVLSGAPAAAGQSEGT